MTAYETLRSKRNAAREELGREIAAMHPAMWARSERIATLVSRLKAADAALLTEEARVIAWAQGVKP